MDEMMRKLNEFHRMAERLLYLPGRDGGASGPVGYVWKHWSSGCSHPGWLIRALHRRTARGIAMWRKLSAVNTLWPSSGGPVGFT